MEGLAIRAKTTQLKNVVDELSTKFRLMRFEDIDNVLKIERQVCEFAWSRGNFEDCLRANYQCYVSEYQHNIQCYGVLSVAVGEAHILNLCVEPTKQGQGLGRQLLQFLLTVAVRQQAEVIFLEVRVSNKIAINLYKKMEFCELGVRPNYYPAKHGREDALVLAKQLNIS